MQAALVTKVGTGWGETAGVEAPDQPPGRMGGKRRGLRLFSRLLPGLLGLLPLLILAAPTQAETTLQRMARSGTAVIGYREASIPFSYVDQQNRPLGYTIELCQRLVSALGKQLGRELKLEYRPVSPANRIEQVVSGQVDLECGSTTNNAERRKKVAFTVPHFISASRFMVKASSGLLEHGDLRRANIVTTRGTTAEKLFQQLNLGTRLEVAPDHRAAFALLESGRADAFLMDDILLASLRASARDPGQFRFLEHVYWIEQLSIMFSRDDPELKAAVDKEMKRLALAGEIHRLYHKWFELPIAPHGINLQWPMSFLLRDALRHPSDAPAD